VNHLNSNHSLSKNTLKIYPNPSSGIVHLEGFPTEKYSISNIQGQLLKEVKVNEIVNDLELNLEDLKPGLYWISVCNQAQTVTKPLIIE
jgi:hypothetical protein